MVKNTCRALFLALSKGFWIIFLAAHSINLWWYCAAQQFFRGLHGHSFIQCLENTIFAYPLWGKYGFWFSLRRCICKEIKIELLFVFAMLEITSSNYHLHWKHPFPILTLNNCFGRVPWQGRDGCGYLVWFCSIVWVPSLYLDQEWWHSELN